MFEDDPVLAGVFTEFLVDEGHVVGAALDPVSALRLAAESHWDVCIADSPTCSNGKLGDEDREIFAALARTAPVIVTTGRAWTNDVDPRDLGVAAILTKPVDFDVLLTTLASARTLQTVAST
jgi:DNA-binding response OmpR family regulator